MLPIRKKKIIDLPSEEPIKNGYVICNIIVSRDLMKMIMTLIIIMTIPITLKRLICNEPPN